MSLGTTPAPAGKWESTPVFYWLAKFVLLGPFLRGLWRPWTEGLENIPDDRPAILASNHLSFCDSFFMPVMVKRKVTFLAKAEYFTTPGIKGFFSRLFFAGVGQVPIDRSDSDASRAALNTGVRVLREGKLLGIYPEGTRSPDGRLYKGKTGVARMALETGAPVIPVAMTYRYKKLPFGLSLPKVCVRFGKPLDFSRYEGLENDRYILRSITDEIMYEIMRLSGQEYVDMYANRAKEESKKSDGEASSSTPPEEQRKAS